MSRRQVDPSRPLTEEERQWLEKISRSQAEPAAHVARAKALLSVAQGLSWQKDRSWCPAGRVLRKRKAGVVEVLDPDAAGKKEADRDGVPPGT
jgi:hypothetical protein